MAAMGSFAPYARSVLRLVVGLMFSCHGFQKLFGLLGGQRAKLGSLPWTAGLIETVGGLLILLGLFTMPAAFILSGEMAVGYWTAHFPRGGFWPIVNRGELAVLYCFIFLYLFTAGPGPLSLDNILRKKHT